MNDGLIRTDKNSKYLLEGYTSGNFMILKSNFFFVVF